MIHVIASVNIKPEFVDSFIEIFKENVPNVLAEKGCIEYIPSIDYPTDVKVQDQNTCMVTVIEKWQTYDDLQSHFTAPHMNDYHEKVDHMVESVTLKILQNA